MSTVKPLRVAVIGAGGIVTHGHIPSLRTIEGVEIVAVCDTNAERVAATAEKFGIPSHYTDWQDVIARDDIDAVTIGVPNKFHAPISLAALQSGKHVMCEKPLAMDAVEGAEAVAAAEKAGKVFAVNLTNRQRSEVQSLKRAAESGRFGDIYYINARLIRRTGIPGFGSWFTRKELAGGGALLDIGVHSLDMALYIAGFPKIKSVHGVVAAKHGPEGRGLGTWGADHIKGGEFSVDDFASLALRLENGGVIKVEVTWAAHAPNEERFQVFGDKGGADMSVDRYGANSPIRYFSTVDGELLDSTPHLTNLNTSNMPTSFARFIDAIRGNGRPGATGAEALQVQYVLDAVYRSSEEGREVSL